MLNNLNFGHSKNIFNTKPYVIAEAGSNFNQDINTALKLIDVAAESGAQAIKFQLFKSEILYPNKTGLFDLFKSIELNPDWVPILSQHAKKSGIHFTASAFDPTSVEVLERVEVPFHKIASSEVTNLQLIHRVASTGKPVLISTGMCDMVDIEEAVSLCRELNNKQIVLLQCGAMYPLPIKMANLKVIKTLENRFGCPCGFSDHTSGFAASLAAVGVGAVVFEKHFTLNKKLKGPDHFYAIEPEELQLYVKYINEASQAMGSSEKKLLDEERTNGRREGLYASCNLNAGQKIRPSDVISRRPAVGLRSRYLDKIIGATLRRSVTKDEPLTWSLLTFE